MFILIDEIKRELSLHTVGVQFQYHNWLETSDLRGVIRTPKTSKIERFATIING